MAHLSAVTPSESEQSTANPASRLEDYLGLQVAAAAAAFLAGVAEYGNCGSTATTRNHAGVLLAELSRLHRCTAGYLDFEVVGRRHGIAVLQANDIPPAIAEAAVTEIFSILRKVRNQLN